MSYKKDMSKYEHLEGWERCGFGEQLDKWAEKYGERTAVTDSEDEISYMELKQRFLTMYLIYLPLPSNVYRATPFRQTDI